MLALDLRHILYTTLKSAFALPEFLNLLILLKDSTEDYIMTLRISWDDIFLSYWQDMLIDF